VRYKAFISYSHGADRELAAALQRGLQGFAGSLGRARRFRVFRDQSDLSVSPSLWRSVEGALNESEFFILLASPEAAQSPWVNKEVHFWCSNRSIDTLLLVLTGGEFNRASALPEGLEELVAAEPLYLDLREVRKSGNLSLQNPVFRDHVATLAATLHGVPKSELIGEDLRQRRTFRRRVIAVGLALAVFATVAIVGSVIARRQSHIASSRELAAKALAEVQKNPDSAVRLTLEAWNTFPTDEAIAALRQTLIEARIRQDFDSIRTNAGRNSSQCEHFHNNEVTSAAANGLKIQLADNGKAMALVTNAGIVGELRGHNNPIGCLTLSPDGKFIVSVADEEAYVWDVNSQQRIKTLDSEPKEDWFRSVAWSPDGKFVVTGSIAGAAVWDPHTWRRLCSFEENGGVDQISVSPDSHHIATASSLEHYDIAQDLSAYIREVCSGSSVTEITAKKTIDDVRFSADGYFVVTGLDHLWRASDGAVVAAWEGDGTTVAAEFDQNPVKLEAGARDTGEGEITIRDVRFSEGGDLLALVDRKDWVTIWHLASLKQLDSMPLSELPGPFALSRDGAMLMVRDGDRSRIRDLRNGGHEISPVPSSMIDEVQTFMRSRQSPDGRWVIDRSSDGTTLLKVRATGQTLATLGGSLANPVEAAFSPDGLRIAVASLDSRVVQIYRWETYAPVEELIRIARQRISK
jgi:WD40 repeat protein